MVDPLSVIGSAMAGIQLVSAAAQALLATIKLMNDLKDVPERLALLLNEVDDSISRLCYCCNEGSKLFHNLDPSQQERLSRTTSAIYPALQDIHKMLTPLLGSSRTRASSVRRLWKSVLSLKVEKELLNLEVIRELGIVGLEVQVNTQGIVIANDLTSRDGFSNIEAKMDLLRNDFQNFTISMHRATPVTSKTSGYFIDPEKQNLSLADGLNENSWSLNSRPDHYSDSISGSTLGTQTPPEGESLSQQKAEQLRRYLAGRFETAIISGPNQVSTSTLPNANLEFVLFSIRTFYTVGNFDASPTITKTKFWEDTDLAIYLMKASKGDKRGAGRSKVRAFQLLKKSTVDTTYTMSQGTATILIELLSTLSPINTTACPEVRKNLIVYLSEQARTQLSCNHPIALVLHALKNDNGDNDLALRALTFITERLRATLGPIHDLTQLATKRLCALLRRSGDLSETLRVTRDGIRAIRALQAPGSLQERWLSRQLEHVYTRQCDWEAALSVCFDIIGQQRLDTSEPDPLYHDECAVYTMEDIAETCERAGNLGQAVAWLKQARISGGMVWGNGDALAHIQDKLHELLRQMGKEDELRFWGVSSGPVTNCE
ncbi:hypothetical protein TSTA_001690 [Talaromyces stipitatus ATCC 10500]|uniref:Fungal N-terminal domain-containing protein n=1 Tax=Talaromyces stipitatus (strain ATCC 10500 / CBS 375.48 / QM 6759 / NRRL 1006) TaxID=441959 RepID=B8MSY3_TALSN|nr:uncharacterized protein TSTA_001690 [Talaromyces stipitatus ATCC 10500]EED12098.1 hypothetical protein TSTA_001690 [Talaromyces stipitatus ATCC 10500]